MDQCSVLPTDPALLVAALEKQQQFLDNCAKAAQGMELKRHPVFKNYLVREDGVIFSCASFPELKERVSASSNVYKPLELWDDGTRLYRNVHQLVCETYHGLEPFENAVVRHLDGNPQNNNRSNLAWGTSQENSQDALKHGSRNFRREEKTFIPASKDKVEDLLKQQGIEVKFHPAFPDILVDATGKVIMQYDAVNMTVHKKCVGINADGYECFNVQWQGKYKRVPIHQAVCRTFHGYPPTSDHVVGHIDGDKKNNHKDNLHWITLKEQGVATAMQGKNRSHLNVEDVLNIKRMLRDGTKQAVIAQKFRICLHTVGLINTGGRWAWVKLEE